MRRTKTSKWKRLDNAAKIFPAIADREDAEVFRLTCALQEDIRPDCLQTALDMTVDEFPTFTQTVRRGIFWYYLEDTGLHPTVHEETKTPLCPLYKSGSRLLLDVSYYKNRINFEIFHALADGTGAFVFLRTMVAHYLVLAHPDELRGVVPEYDDHTARQKESDGFTQYFEPKAGSSVRFEFLGSKSKKQKIYHFSERKTPDYRQLLTEGVTSAEKIKAAARAEGATMTQFLCAVLMLSIYDTMEPKDRKKRIVIALPVNLRQYFASDTLRNFFGMIQVHYDFDGTAEPDLHTVIEAVREECSRELTYENMQQKIASQVKMERNPVVRICPLCLKDLTMVLLQDVSMKRRTICLSNVGRVYMQPELAPYIDSFGIFNSSSARQICVATFGDRMTMNFSGILAEHDVERAFFRRMSAYDDQIAVSASYSPEEFR